MTSNHSNQGDTSYTHIYNVILLGVRIVEMGKFNHAYRDIYHVTFIHTESTRTGLWVAEHKGVAEPDNRVPYIT